ncbi:G domain-containing protein [Candidatus Electronema halotolerans]|jgi:predicted GTPase
MMIPEFAIVGHPNEGKSSVVSTLSEDDSVRISPVPGETTECRRFPVLIDGREVIRFIDTPGFQNPRKTLAWMRAWQGNDQQMLTEFLRIHGNDPALHDDCALLTPLAAGAGIIFVVDGSRPLRNMDKAEMEILRLTGRPRMAIINCKDEESRFLADWQNEFRKHFNSIRLFNANKATYSQRIALLNSLKAIDQDLEELIERVIQAFAQDWENRRRQSAALITAMLKDSLDYRASAPCPTGTDEERLRAKLRSTYTDFVTKRERTAHQQLRRLFKHNLFNLQLPEQSILQEDLFDATTWKFLGLSDEDLIWAAAMSGAAVGAGMDVLAAGISFGVFMAIGGAVGAVGAAVKGRDLLTGRRLLGMKLDKQQMQVGPVTNIQLLYILLDRALLYYSHVVSWAHGRRDHAVVRDGETEKQGYASEWTAEEKKICDRFFRALQKNDQLAQEETEEALVAMIQAKLGEMAGG